MVQSFRWIVGQCFTAHIVYSVFWPNNLTSRTLPFNTKYICALFVIAKCWKSPECLGVPSAPEGTSTQQKSWPCWGAKRLGLPGCSNTGRKHKILSRGRYLPRKREAGVRSGGIRTSLLFLFSWLLECSLLPHAPASCSAHGSKQLAVHGATGSLCHSQGRRGGQDPPTLALPWLEL